MPESQDVSLDFTAGADSGIPNAGASNEASITEVGADASDRPQVPVSAHVPARAATRQTSSQETAVGASPDRFPDTGPSRLVGSAEDAMTLHTRAAYSLFNGRRFDAAAKLSPIVGARRFAWAVRSIWLLSGNDNPYADWLLIRIDDEFAALRARLQDATQRTKERIERLRSEGFQLSVLKSASPKMVALGFQSPYGFTAAALILDLDRFVRLTKTLVHTDQLSDQEGSTAIYSFVKPMRALFMQSVPWRQLLFREALREHARRDFDPHADAAERARVEMLASRLGPLPADVLLGHKVPRHTRRRVRLSAEDVESLKAAALTLDDGAEILIEGLL